MKTITTLESYEFQASAFHVPGDVRLASYTLGLVGETAEVAALAMISAGALADYIKKHIGHGHPLDLEKLKLELGDVLWYVAMLAHINGLSLMEVANANIEKLQKRYPNGFSTEASINR